MDPLTLVNDKFVLVSKLLTFDIASKSGVSSVALKLSPYLWSHQRRDKP